jgi:5'-3' exonuclease
MIDENNVMGIPSYFRSILQKYPGCIAREVKADVLCYDFNCLIYRCVYSDRMPEYTVEGHDEWEELLLKEVVRTVKEVWTVAGKPKKVYLAVDGVVPMAKIRQQRVRRFKSVWLKKQAEGSRVNRRKRILGHKCNYTWDEVYGYIGDCVKRYECELDSQWS